VTFLSTSTVPFLAADPGVATFARSFTHLGVRALARSAAPSARLARFGTSRLS